MSTRYLLLAFVALASVRSAEAQAVRFDSQSTTTSASCVSGKQCPLLVLPGTQVNFCQGLPSTLSGCLSGAATTYTNATAGTPCPLTAQLTPAIGGSCLSTADSQGGFGGWFLPGSYGYYLRVPASAGGGTYGPYPISLGASEGCPLGATCDANYATLALACTGAGSGSLYITRNWPATPTQTLACKPVFLGNGKITTATSAVVTMPVPEAPSNQRIFDTSASGSSVVLTGPGDLQPMWWGADPTGVTDSTAAIQAMLVNATVRNVTFASRQLAASYKITSTLTLSVPVAVGANSPGPVLDCGGATLLTSHTSGSGLHVISQNIAGYQGVTLQNCTIQYTGATANVIGLLVEDFTRPTLNSVKVIGFNTSGAEGIQLKNVEEARMSAIYLTGNTLGLHLTNESTANRLDGASVLQGNVMAILVDKGSYGFTADGNVIQSNTGVHAMEVRNATGDPDSITETRIHNNHFEFNGDGTANSRDVYFYADAARFILTTSLKNNIFNVPNGAATAITEFAGAGTFQYVTLDGNQCASAAALTSGVTSLFVGSTQNNCTMGDYDTSNNSGGALGTIYWSSGASKKYNLLAGRPGAFDGFFQLDDITTGTPSHIIRASTAGVLTLTLFPLNGSQNIGSSGARWPVGYFTLLNSTNSRFINGPISPLYRIIGYTSGGSPTWADLQDALTAAGIACSGGSNQGMTGYVTDGNATGYGSIVSAGGGVNSVFLVCNGNNWIVH